MIKIILSAVTLFILGGILLFFWQWRSGSLAPSPVSEIKNMANEPQIPVANLSLPLNNALSRVSKKPFGIYITPKNSPVSPEKFTGWHTGADFEIFPGEENKDISVFAICKGKLLVKEFGRGYGGMLVQACDINNQPATVVYGHLKLSSVTFKVGDYIVTGSNIGILGKGYTNETDYERKHLHLGIHKGSAIDTRGYIAAEAELQNWMDPLLILK